MNLPQYDVLNDALQAIGIDYSAAAWHGLVSGALAVNVACNLERCLQTVWSPEQGMGDYSASNLALLAELYSGTQGQLTDSNLQFELLLPSDESLAFGDQVQALIDWCEGFLYGLAVGGLRDMNKLPEQVEEIIEDFQKIAQVEVEEQESDEEALYELTEFVRVSTLLIAEEIQPMRMNTQIQ